MAINTALETFEDNAKRILWLPSITLGYTYTLSGVILQFALAVAAIGGAALFRSLIESDFVTDSEGEMAIRSAPFEWIRKQFPNWKTWLFAGFSLVYLVAVVYAPYQLYQHFTHQNVVLVGLAGVWWGILTVLLVNL